MLNKDFGTNINIDKVGLQFNGDVELKNIFIEDYDFSENYLDLDKNYEILNGKYLKSVATAIEINKEEDGTFEYYDGIWPL